MNSRFLCGVGVAALAIFATACGRGEIRSDQVPTPLDEQLSAAHRSRQRSTMADMRNIATANAVMRLDTGGYAQSLAELVEKNYMRVVAPTDAWGTAWAYSTGADTYTLTSLGSDGAPGPAPPRVWLDEPYDPDIVLTDGQFTQAPTGR